MWVFPVTAALVAAAFAAALVRRYVGSRRPYELVWALALLMYAGASIAVAFGVANGWTSGEFRVYWALGAVLNVPFLAAGELDLLIHRRGVRWTLYVVLAFLTGAWFREAALLATLPVASGALATSGDYERFIEVDGVRHCHVLDPRTGLAARGCPRPGPALGQGGVR